MRGQTVEEWSRKDSYLHRVAPGAKLLPLVLLLVILNTAHQRVAVLSGILGLILCLGFAIAELPIVKALLRAGVVLPFSLLFSGLLWWTAGPERGVALLLKSYISAAAVLLTAATTPLPDLVRTLEVVKVPAFLLSVIQFLYRYLFLILEEGGKMRQAAAARGGMTFHAAAGALAQLFARSYQRAQAIHRAMIARGFSGRFPALADSRFRAVDTLFAACACLLILAARLGVEAVR